MRGRHLKEENTKQPGVQVDKVDHHLCPSIFRPECGPESELSGPTTASHVFRWCLGFGPNLREKYKSFTSKYRL